MVSENNALQKKLSKTSAMTQDELKTLYSDTVRDILENHYLLISKEPFNRDYQEKLITAWTKHFLNARIPLTKLYDVYDRATKGKENNSFFDAFSMTHAWDLMQQ